MSTTTSAHHHHHHHHQDGASRFKAKSLASIQRRKLIAKWLYRALVVIAIALALTTVVLVLLGD